MAGALNYASLSDVAAYEPHANPTDEAAMWGVFLSTASRDIDRYCERYFYPAGTATKYFSGDGSSELYIPKHDFYSLTALKIALVENNDPATSGSWYTITGDGVTPPSNFYLKPSNPVEIGATSDETSKRPYYSISLPGQPIPTSTGVDWLGAFTKGNNTVAITASWGWPVVPDEIKDIVVRIAVRMWRGNESGQERAPMPGQYGPILSKYLDPGDLNTLNDYRRTRYI